MLWSLNVMTLWIFLIGVLTIGYLYIMKQYSYWEKKGVPFQKPNFLLGSFADMIMNRLSMSEMMVKLYKELKGERFGGIWQIYTPSLLVIDPKLIRDIMVKDFDAWPDRGINVNSEIDPLSQNIVNLEGWAWKTVRSKLTPTFTSAKLKNMHYLLIECGDAFEKHLGELANNGKLLEARESSARFTTDVIGSCAFGIKMNSLSQEDALFRRMGRKLFAPSKRKEIIEILQTSFPWLYKFLNLSTTDKEVEKFFIKITKESFDSREKMNLSNGQRHDFIDLLQNLRDTSVKTDEGEVEFTDELLTAQALVFFAAGFETSSSTISFCLYELAVNKDIQNRLREEIRNARSDNDGEITWNCLQKMNYLDMVFQETLRKYPIAPVLGRISVKPYRIPGTKIDLPKGMTCLLPIYSLHHDSQYYPDPGKFIPERFTEEAKSQRIPYTYLPFGGGPRVCIGARFAEQQTKIGVVKAIENFELSLCEKSQNPLRLDIKSRLLAPERGIWLKVSNYRN